MTAMAIAERRPGTKIGLTSRVNGAGHLKALTIYLMVVAAHWVEHGVQAIQIYVLGMPRPQSLGLIGQIWPFLFTSELLHWAYAAFMLAGLVLMRHSFTGSARRWWNLALWIQVWHFFEHLILLVQWWAGVNLAGRPVPTSVIQLVLPRVELHLIYNMIVLIPLLVAVSLHWFSRDGGALAEPGDTAPDGTAPQDHAERHAEAAPATETRCTCAARFAVPD
ncbi:MAG: hypothetical protein GEV11_28385 [Streptosporangiales bacterium]|nr:hypothetical protein [Streptosporangiales bacterium]